MYKSPWGECKDFPKIVISTKEPDTEMRITQVEECARHCRGISTTFGFGEGVGGCSVHGCKCQCELDTYDDGSCQRGTWHSKGMALYRFDQGKLRLS